MQGSTPPLKVQTFRVDDELLGAIRAKKNSSLWIRSVLKAALAQEAQQKTA